MIDRDRRAFARTRQVFRPHHLEPVDKPQRGARDEGERVGRQVAEDVDRRDDIGEAEDDERGRLAQPTTWSRIMVTTEPATIMR